MRSLLGYIMPLHREGLFPIFLFPKTTAKQFSISKGSYGGDREKDRALLKRRRRKAIRVMIETEPKI